MSFRKLSLLFVVITSVVLLGCTRRDAVVDGPTSDQPQELVVYGLFDDENAFKGQFQAFKSQYKTGVKYVQFTDPKEYEETLINELAEGRGPDIFMIHNTWVPKHLGKMAEMPMDLPVAMTPEQYDQTFFHVATDDLILDNKIYGIPFSVDTLALYYNEEYLVSAVPGTNRPGRTWDEIKKHVIALTKADNSPERFAVSGISLGRADNIARAVDILYMLFIQHEIDFYDVETQQATFAKRKGVLEGTGKPYYPGVEALKLFTSFGLPSYNHYTWNKEITGKAPDEMELNPFIRGKSAMMFGYSSLYSQIKQGIENQQKIGGKYIDLNDVKIVEVPQLLDPRSSNKIFAYASYWPFVVSKSSENVNASWTLLQFLSTKESLEQYFKVTKRPTSRLDMQAEQSLDPVYGAFARQAQYAKSLKILDYDFYEEVFREAIQDVIGTKTLSSSLNKAQKRVNCLIEVKAKKRQGTIADCLKIE